MSSFEDLEREIENVRNEFYSETKKNTFFKKQQKHDCANQVASQIPMHLLLERGCWAIPNTNYVRIVYPILKMFASPDTFDIIVDHIIRTCHNVKNEYGTMTVMLNLEGFTVSAAERYKRLVEIFCNRCFNEELQFSTLTNAFIIYNTPNSIESIKPIIMPFVSDELKSKVQLIPKKDSVAYLARLGLEV
jgi:hypothetical protein